MADTTITYNGKTTNLSAEQTGTIECKGKLMSDDVVISASLETTILCNGKETKLSSGQTATLKCKDMIMLDNVVVNVGERPLSAPIISLSGDILTITSTDNRTEMFALYINGYSRATFPYNTYDLTKLELSEGTYTIAVKARKGELPYAEYSEQSNAVTYVFKENCTLSGTWTLRNTIDLESFYQNILSWDVKFISSSHLVTNYFTHMSVSDDGVNFIYRAENGASNTVYTTVNGWVDSEYRIVTFNGEQNVERSCYNWFLANTEEMVSAPTISLDGDILTITATDDRTQAFTIFVDGYARASLADNTYDLSRLELDEGEHFITVKAKAEGLADSKRSDAVSYVVGTAFTTNVPKLEFSPYEYGTSCFPFYGTGQVVLSGGTGKYSVSDSAITAIGGVTTSLVDGVYTMHIDIKNGYGIGGTFYIYFSDGVTTIEFPIVIEYCVCLTGDALITLADGTQKRIDQLTFDDKILAVNPETGELVPDIITFLDNDLEKTHYHYHRFVFEDGTEIKTVHRHRFYNIEEQMMSHMDLFLIGDHVYKVDGTTTRIISGEEVVENVRHYTLFSRYQNYFVNGILSGNRFTPYMAIGQDKIKDGEAALENLYEPVMSQCSEQASNDVTMLDQSLS